MQSTLAIAVAFYVTIGMFEAIWAVLLRDHGAETWLIGLTLSLFTVPMIFLAPIGGRVAQRRGPQHVVTISVGVAALCTLSYGVLPSLWMLLGASLVHAVADSFTMPGNQVSAALASPPQHVRRAGPARRDRPRRRRAHRPRGRGPLRGVGPARGVRHHRRSDGAAPACRARLLRSDARRSSTDVPVASEGAP